jgi:hypothetical protein
MSVSRQEAVRRLKESVSGHRTGLPKKLLDLFAPRDDLGSAPPVQKRKPALPYNGLAQYVSQFAEQGDPEYEPPPPEDRPPSPRLYRNRELDSQARINTESKLEKCVDSCTLITRVPLLTPRASQENSIDEVEGRRGKHLAWHQRCYCQC